MSKFSGGKLSLICFTIVVSKYLYCLSKDGGKKVCIAIILGHCFLLPTQQLINMYLFAPENE